MSIELPNLLIATNNLGKVEELKHLFAGRPIELRSLLDFENIEEVEETGSTFAENARLKARGYAAQTGLIALADDSGLEVAALDNRPGIFSARYGGKEADFGERIAMLLDELERTGDPQRIARFVCVIAIANAEGSILIEVEGICSGKIAAGPIGSGGFGYDPIFIPDGFDQTFGELPQDVKQRISHRGRAFSEIIPFLLDFNAV